MADKIDVPNVMTPKFRVSFPNVFRPGKPVDPTKAGKYSVTMLFDKDANLEPLKQAMVDFLMHPELAPHNGLGPDSMRSRFIHLVAIHRRFDPSCGCDRNVGCVPVLLVGDHGECVYRRNVSRMYYRFANHSVRAIETNLP
mgnify:CR=1 FL=1